MKKNGFLFLNGTPPSKKLLSKYNLDSGFVICADGAYNYAKDFCKVDLILGDFDSLDLEKTSLNSETKIKKFAKEKDFTDGHLSIIEMAENGVTNLIIFGAIGGRIDHQYSNFTLLSVALEQKIQAEIADERFAVYLIDGKFEKKVRSGAIISLEPFSDEVHILQANGLGYNAENLTFSRLNGVSKRTMGISNYAITDKIYLSVSGKLLVFIEN